ncbi:phosphoenolpyruvate--protein phosphotransferase [Cerasicoccus arenae]|uniref:phosphoenolpyruvate--protein phosphotransferase n=1 Tax=Cerasicoccus arenae TaxID=424488 RepID=A0A8J3DGN1_9BACT|nr:phosphoenolpyruvate--protein phosphotransferase [Cerasicoccus arenae]MBK1858298.1 phosphoenolpyruvate--protein phosphotransferase [Cerasicoccus arenae]GHB90610.1 phosphoenolpyruvate--protein phosphotransferase [Cerasicoccus arenae]
MLNLTPSDIRLGQSFKLRESAIRAVADLLAERGAVDPQYVNSMLGREQTANTYLGNGVAIPHGRPQEANLIKETRVALIQVPDGVPWKGEERAQLIFGIAAKSDEHIGLLGRLTAITSDSDLAKRLAHTTDPAEIVRALNNSEAGNQQTADDGFVGRRVVVSFNNPRGFHLRPASQIAEVTERMDGNISLVANGREADARSAMSIVGLGISAGSDIEIRSDSPYADDHLRQLQRLVEIINEEPQENTEEAEPSVHWQPTDASKEQILHGTMAAPGIAVGPIFLWDQARVTTATRKRGDVHSEQEALAVAIASAIETLEEFAADPAMNKVQRNLFGAHSTMLGDETLRSQALKKIDDKTDAQQAWESVVAEQVSHLESLSDANLAQRGIDLKDAGSRVTRILLGADQQTLANLLEPTILIAGELEPSEAAQLTKSKICGICLREGSPNAHSAIVARSLGIPMVVAMGDSLDHVTENDKVILDASGSRLILNPSAEDQESACVILKTLDAQRKRAWTDRFQPALTQDGHRMEVVANIARVAEAEEALKAGAEGIGLVRTEFLFLDREHAPSEDEQYESYKAMVKALNGLPMVLRTIDIGGDKPVDYLGMSERDLSFLGLRGIRIGLARPDILRTQLRAVYRAAQHGEIKLLFPMIATSNDFRRIRNISESVRQEIDGPRIELGVMIEVPSAVIMASELAKVADFFSVGTNDLTQYALAVDRTHPLLAKRADGLHPVVLRLIDMATKAAHAEGKWIGVCGGIAADTLGAQILTGLGIDELSMPPSVIPGIKEKLRKSHFSELQRLAKRALQQEDAVAVRLLPIK